ncbi:hypothetical protein C0J52_01732 [Blattella germanica]|nr:hypothetical protein C0J52_01732 [Blattella germanica]
MIIVGFYYVCCISSLQMTLKSHKKMAPCEKSIDDYCRLCAVETKNGVIIYSSAGVNLCLEEKIIQCLRIEVSKDDMLPKKVCRPCRARLEDYHKFAERANRVQHTLELLIQMKNNVPTEPMLLDTKNQDVQVVDVKSDPVVDVKKDPEDIEIKDELMELPLDVTLVSGDNHIEQKPNSSEYEEEEDEEEEEEEDDDDDRSITGLQDEEEEVEEVEIDEEADKNAKEEWKAHWGIKCHVCENIFPYKSLFDKHYRSSYDKKPIYTCSYCNKTMEKYSTFRSHCYRHVTEGRYRLHTRGGLTAHQNVHKLGRRFMCDVCGKTFTQKVNMQQHVKHHTGERPFACEKCGKCFAEKSHLNRHYSFHSEKRPFQCKICLKMYKTERCLKVHAMVHAEARPYVCTYCNKGFLSTTKLKQHYNIHTGERPYACKFCERTFTNYPNWLKHTRRRHKTDARGSAMIATRVVIQNQETQPMDLMHLQQQEQPEEVLPDDGRGSVNCHTPQSQASLHVIPVACLTATTNSSVSSGMSLMAPYPSHQSHSQPHPAHQTQQPHPAHQNHHQTLTPDSRMQPPLPLAQVQVYPEHMMAIPMPHHHILPL